MSEEKDMRNKCYKCKHRGELPGNAHSKCEHPDISKYNNANETMNISFDQYGYESGWFYWPLNFDPVWLRTCDGFSEKKEKWVMPEWMEKYREHIQGHGGNGVDDLMNRIRTEKHLSQTNMIVFIMCCKVSAQVNMLYRLRSEGIID